MLLLAPWHKGGHCLISYRVKRKSAFLPSIIICMQNLTINDQSVHQKGVSYLLSGLLTFLLIFSGVSTIVFFASSTLYLSLRPFPTKRHGGAAVFILKQGMLRLTILETGALHNSGLQWEKKKKGCLVTFVCNNEAQIKRRVEGDTRSQRTVGRFWTKGESREESWVTAVGGEVKPRKIHPPGQLV